MALNLEVEMVQNLDHVMVPCWARQKEVKTVDLKGCLKECHLVDLKGCLKVRRLVDVTEYLKGCHLASMTEAHLADPKEYLTGHQKAHLLNIDRKETLQLAKKVTMRNKIDRIEHAYPLP
jgi:hypothetical protein